MLKHYFFKKLDDAGIPWFFVYANHDDLDDAEFAMLFDYTKNFAVRIGGDKALLSAFDVYATPNPGEDQWGYGAVSRLDENFLTALTPMIDTCQDAILYMHYSNQAGPALRELIQNSSTIRVLIQGHTHNNYGVRLTTNALGQEVWAYDIGHFSWNADTSGMAGRNESDGSVILTGQLTGNAENEFYAGNWSFTYIDSEMVNAKREISYYFIYPELYYGKLSGGGNAYGSASHEAFRQERYSTKNEPVKSGNYRYGVVYKED